MDIYEIRHRALQSAIDWSHNCEHSVHEYQTTALAELFLEFLMTGRQVIPPVDSGVSSGDEYPIETESHDPAMT